jgi:hypothetical protein
VNEWKCLSKRCACQQAETGRLFWSGYCVSSLAEASDRNKLPSLHLPLMCLELVSPKQCVLVWVCSVRGMQQSAVSCGYVGCAGSGAMNHRSRWWCGKGEDQVKRGLKCSYSKNKWYEEEVMIGEMDWMS